MRKNVLLLTKSDIIAFKESPVYACHLKIRFNQLNIDISKVDEIIVTGASTADIDSAKKLLDYLSSN